MPFALLYHNRQSVVPRGQTKAQEPALPGQSHFTSSPELREIFQIPSQAPCEHHPEGKTAAPPQGRWCSVAHGGCRSPRVKPLKPTPEAPAATPWGHPVLAPAPRQPAPPAAPAPASCGNFHDLGGPTGSGDYGLSFLFLKTCSLFLFPSLQLHWKSESSAQKHGTYFVQMVKKTWTNTRHFPETMRETKAVKPAVSMEDKSHHCQRLRAAWAQRSVGNAEPLPHWEGPESDPAPSALNHSRKSPTLMGILISLPGEYVSNKTYSKDFTIYFLEYLYTEMC